MTDDEAWRTLPINTDDPDVVELAIAIKGAVSMYTVSGTNLSFKLSNRVAQALIAQGYRRGASDPQLEARVEALERWARGDIGAVKP